jgi:beta-lactamase class A
MGRNGPNFLRLVSLGLLLGAAVLFFFQLIAYSRERANLPEGLTIAGVPVGGMSKPSALERLLQTYSTPVELFYEGERIVLSPSQVGFQVDTEAMLAAGELARTNTDFWSGFWDFLWDRPGEPQRVPLRAEYSRPQLESALRDVAARYDEPALPSQPVPGSADFQAGRPGRLLDIGRSLELVGEVLSAPGDRRVNLPVLESQANRPSLPTLETLLKQNLDVEAFDGLVVMYVMDLRTGQELHFGYYLNADISVSPDIAFDAGSTIKVGIATAFYRYFDEPLDDEATRWLVQMLTQSGNDPANWLMERIDFGQGPVAVTESLSALGLENSYIVAWFENPRRFTTPAQLIAASPPATPANQRLDINTRPNQLNQTTASELGMLLADLYGCAKGGGGLLAAFPEQLRPEECARILDLLAQNRIAWLIEASVPDGTRVAHKQGYIQSPLDFLSDAGIVYSPGGDYVVSIFMWDDREMVWEPTAALFAQLGRAVYNYFNPPASG